MSDLRKSDKDNALELGERLLNGFSYTIGRFNRPDLEFRFVPYRGGYRKDFTVKGFKVFKIPRRKDMYNPGRSFTAILDKVLYVLLARKKD